MFTLFVCCCINYVKLKSKTLKQNTNAGQLVDFIKFKKKCV